MELTEADPVLLPPPLRSGDKVRFSRQQARRQGSGLPLCKVLESWGLEVDFGEHVFRKVAWLAGTDEERLADFNAALRDPSVRALFTAAGGKGSCRIADRLDFAAVRRDPKFLVGISDITALQLSLWKHCRLVSVHGSFVPDGQDSETLRKAMMTSEGICLHSSAD
jgi:muramoyltetrapeptide carboxypeptidase